MPKYRSAEIRKYEAVYKELIKNKRESPKRLPRKKDNTIVKKIEERKKKIEKKPLNEYQIFVKEEGKKEKYKHLPGSLRMAEVAKTWDKYKKKKKN
jgi:hypothetical protein